MSVGSACSAVLLEAGTKQGGSIWECCTQKHLSCPSRNCGLSPQNLPRTIKVPPAPHQPLSELTPWNQLFLFSRARVQRDLGEGSRVTRKDQLLGCVGFGICA